MPDAPAPPSPTPPAPSLALAGLAAVLPIVFPFVAMIILIAAAQDAGGMMELVEEGGGFAWATFGVTALAALILAVLLFLAARGARVPSAIGLFVAGLPWITGLAGMRFVIHDAERAIAFAGVGHRPAMMARGIADATALRILGTTMASSLLGALAVGLALAALARRAPNRRALIALPLAAVGLLAAGLAAALLSEAAHHAIWLPLVAGLGGALALGLGGAAAGADRPHGRSAALAAAAGAAASLALIAAIEMIDGHALRTLFAALARADVASRPLLLARGGDDVVAAGAASKWPMLLMALGAVALAIWAASRARPTGGRIAGAVAVLVVGAIPVVLDGVATRGASAALADVARAPWADIPGFVPLELTGIDDPQADALVLADRVVILDSSTSLPIPADGDAAARAPLARALDRQLDPPDIIAPGSEEDRELGLAVDARVTGATLRRVLAAIAETRAFSIAFVGNPVETPGARAAMAQARTTVPLLAPALEQRAARSVPLHFRRPPPPDGGGPHAVPRRDRFTGTITPSRTFTLEPAFEGPNATPLTIDRDTSPSEWSPRPRDPFPAFLSIAPDATAADVIDILERLTATHHPVLVPGELPDEIRTPDPVTPD